MTVIFANAGRPCIASKLNMFSHRIVGPSPGLPGFEGDDGVPVESKSVCASEYRSELAFAPFSKLSVRHAFAWRGGIARSAASFVLSAAVLIFTKAAFSSVVQKSKPFSSRSHPLSPRMRISLVCECRTIFNMMFPFVINPIHVVRPQLSRFLCRSLEEG